MRKGTSYYDEMNDRLIKVHSVNEDAKTASCDVAETDDRGEYNRHYMQNFTLQELSKFKEVNIW